MGRRGYFKANELKMPEFAKTSFIFLISIWGVLILARFITFCLVSRDLFSSIPMVDISDLMTAVYIGIKFDGRIAVLISSLLALALFIPYVEHRLSVFKYVFDAIYLFIFAIIEFVYIIDYGYFFYLHQRVDGTLWGFLKDASISIDMVFQSYPIVTIWIAFSFFTTVFVFLLHRLMIWHEHRVLSEAKISTFRLKDRFIWGVTILFCFFVIAYGQISPSFFPLRWSNAFFSSNRDLVLLGLNPVQNLYDTQWNLNMLKPDEGAVKIVYPEMSRWLRVDSPNLEKLNFWRTMKPTENTKKRNVVLIIMESLSWPMTSFAPGDDDPTPYLREIASKGVYFSNYYASARTTARAVFSIMTGIPDANRNGGTTTSRNQQLVQQYIPMSDFKGYEKYYMLGGNANWANIRGLLQHNIPKLHLLEEGYWKSPIVDVWGISDLNLFREGVTALSASTKPFVAVIQTAGFHRPYTIPKDSGDFKTKIPTKEILRNYGFTSPEQYNSLRLSDYSLGEFFKLASKEPWFKNTVFAITGDHGLWEKSPNMPAGYLACALQGYHVPLIIVAPGLIDEDVNTQACGHCDLFPTLSTLAGVPARIHGTGRNLFAKNAESDARQYIAGDDENYRILIEGKYCYIRMNKEGLYRLDDLEGKNLIMSDMERAERMRRFAEAYHQTTKYLLFNNKKRP